MSNKSQTDLPKLPRKQIIRIQTLISTNNLRGQKETLVESFTEDRTTHVSEMKLKEAKELIHYLNGINKNKVRSFPGQKQRRRIISRAYSMNWVIEEDSKRKADMKRINDWCIKYGYLHKPLNDYSIKELPRLVNQFEKMYISFLESI